MIRLGFAILILTTTPTHATCKITIPHPYAYSFSYDLFDAYSSVPTRSTVDLFASWTNTSITVQIGNEKVPVTGKITNNNSGLDVLSVTTSGLLHTEQGAYGKKYLDNVSSPTISGAQWRGTATTLVTTIVGNSRFILHPLNGSAFFAGLPYIIEPDAQLCSRLATTHNRTIAVTTYATLGMRHNNTAIINGTLRSQMQARSSIIVEYPTKISAIPTEIHFGRLTTAATGQKRLDVTVQAATGTRYSLEFSYASETDTQENMTINGHTLPYAAPLTVTMGRSSRTEVFDVRLTSSVAAEVKGRLLITARIT
ncbi:hypothetical protein IO173_004155 [Salmonella enterica]|nr:hypothetical protein [Salmonella enterica]